MCTLWSTQNSAHESRLRELAREELPEAFVSVSNEISPAVGEYARMSTTAANAALGPVAGRYLSRLETTLREAGMAVPVLMMTCAGGVLPTGVLATGRIRSLIRPGGRGDGLAGDRRTDRCEEHSDDRYRGNQLRCRRGGRWAGRDAFEPGDCGRRNPRAFDRCQFDWSGGRQPRIRPFGELRVGPQSAGANPGPACYGRGGTSRPLPMPISCWASRPENFLGGRMRAGLGGGPTAIDGTLPDRSI